MWCGKRFKWRRSFNEDWPDIDRFWPWAAIHDELCLCRTGLTCLKAFNFVLLAVVVKDVVICGIFLALVVRVFI